jgi:hypothetical protein
MVGIWTWIRMAVQFLCLFIVHFNSAPYLANADNGMFTNARIDWNLTSAALHVPLDINITFRPSRNLFPNEGIVISMPRFTRRFLGGNTTFTAQNRSFLDISMGNLMIAPSIHYIGSWTEGSIQAMYDPSNATNLNNTPFAHSYLTIRGANGYIMPQGVEVTITVYRHNGIAAFCGFPDSVAYASLSVAYRTYMTDRFTIGSTLSPNISASIFESNITSRVLDYYPGLGNGCDARNNCNGHGACDYCREVCHCFEGFGAPTDMVTRGGQMNPNCLDSKYILSV